MITFRLTKSQIEYLEVVRKRFPTQETISRTDMITLISENLWPTFGHWLQKHPDAKKGHGQYLVPTVDQIELYTPVVGRASNSEKPAKETKPAKKAAAPKKEAKKAAPKTTKKATSVEKSGKTTKASKKAATTVVTATVESPEVPTMPAKRRMAVIAGAAPTGSTTTTVVDTNVSA